MIGLVASLLILTAIIAIGEPVTELPWGLEPALQTYADYQNFFQNSIPYMAPVIDVILIAMIVNVGLFTHGNNIPPIKNSHDSL